MGTMDILKMMLVSIFRYLLAGVVGSLIGKGIITGFQGEMLIYIATGTVLVIVTSLWSKFNVKEKIEIALDLPAGTSTEKFKEAIEEVKRVGGNSVVSLCLVMCLVFPLTIPLSGCSKTNLKKAAEAAKDINMATLRVVRAVAQAYDKKLIGLETKDKLADLLKKMADAGFKGTQIIDYLNSKYNGNTSLIPQEEWRNIFVVFDDGVVAPFLEILRTLGALSPDNAYQIRIALQGVRSLVLVIASAFNRKASLEREFIKLEYRRDHYARVRWRTLNV